MNEFYYYIIANEINVEDESLINEVDDNSSTDDSQIELNQYVRGGKYIHIFIN